MSESLVFDNKDYDFEYAWKPCGTRENHDKSSGQCIKNAETECHLFSICDLREIKRPWKKPTLARKWKRPKRGLHLKVFPSGAQLLKNKKE